MVQKSTRQIDLSKAAAASLRVMPREGPAAGLSEVFLHSGPLNLAELAELEQCWEHTKQGGTIANEDVTAWLQTWGTAHFRAWGTR